MSLLAFTTIWRLFKECDTKTDLSSVQWMRKRSYFFNCEIHYYKVFCHFFIYIFKHNRFECYLITFRCKTRRRKKYKFQFYSCFNLISLTREKVSKFKFNLGISTGWMDVLLPKCDDCCCVCLVTRALFNSLNHKWSKSKFDCCWRKSSHSPFSRNKEFKFSILN